jgi:hypothetical protein
VSLCLLPFCMMSTPILERVLLQEGQIALLPQFQGLKATDDKLRKLNESVLLQWLQSSLPTLDGLDACLLAQALHSAYHAPAISQVSTCIATAAATAAAAVASESLAPAGASFRSQVARTRAIIRG